MTPNIFRVLHDEQRLIKLAHLAEIFGKANEITTLLQRKTSSIFIARDKLTAIKKIGYPVWKKTTLNVFRLCIIL